MKRNFNAVRTAAGVAALGAIALAVPTVASATTLDATAIKPNSFISAPTGVHNAPSTQAPAAKTVAAGTPVQALCFIPNGERVQGNENWFRIAVDDQIRGWVPRAAIGGVPALPQC